MDILCTPAVSNNCNDILCANGAQSDLLKSYFLNDYDFHKICRCCLLVHPEMVSLKDEDGTDFFEIFASIADLEVLPNDSLPSQMCLTCKEELKRCIDFRTQCQKSDSILKSMLKANFLKDEETSKTIDICESDAQDHNIKLELSLKEEPYTDSEFLVVALCEDNSNDSSITKEVTTNKPGGCKKCNSDPHDENIKLKSATNKQTYYADGDFLVMALCEDDDSNIAKESKTKKRGRPKKKRTHITVQNASTTQLKEMSNADNMHACEICLKSFRTLKALKAHSHSADEPISCTQCGKSFASDRDLKLHAALHSEDHFRCTECHKMFPSKTKLRRHIDRHMENKKHHCVSCAKTFSERYALIRHQRVHTGEALQKKHVCDVCNKRYASASALLVHRRTHTGERPHVCEVCACAFPSPRLLRSHMLRHTDAKPHCCLYCDKRFRHESTRIAHHRTHTGDRPYVCATCGNRFISSTNLRTHMRTHTGEKPYACAVCARQFSSHSSLRNHENTHTKAKPYKCFVCNKRFARRDLREHLQRHSGERPFGCSACPKRFFTRARLREHAATHSGQKNLECALCQRKFATKSQLIKHIKVHDKSTKRKPLVVRRVTDDSPYTAPATKAEPSDVINQSLITSTPDIPLTYNEKDMNYFVVNMPDGFESPNRINIAGDLNLGSNVDVMSVGDAVNIAAPSVNLYQVDQSLVQIHSEGGKLTIRKITSKMTANF